MKPYLVGPKGLKPIEGTYANIHELNYLAKRMDSFDGTEMGKLLAAASRFDTRDLRQLINYTFNLGRITLIQNISDMQNPRRVLFQRRIPRSQTSRRRSRPAEQQTRHLDRLRSDVHQR